MLFLSQSTVLSHGDASRKTISYKGRETADRRRNDAAGDVGVASGTGGYRALAVFNAWVKGRPVPPMVCSRPGLIPVLLDLPFIKLGNLSLTPDFMMSVSPILLTAALVTVLFIWLRKLASVPR
jgi:hypothetical protein